MKVQDVGNFRTFSEVASRTLGLEEDRAELISLSAVLERIEDLYRRDLLRFDNFVKDIEEDNQFFRELNNALDGFCGQLARQFGLADSKVKALRYVPVEEVVTKSGARSDAHRQFLANAAATYRFNKSCGNHLFDFYIARSLTQSGRYNHLNIGMRSKIISYAGSLESIFSIWESNQFGQVWTLPGTVLPKNAYAAACYRLMDGLRSSLQLEAAYEIFCRNLNPLEKFPVQFLYNVIMSDQKTVLQEIMQDNRGSLPKYTVTRAGGNEHAPMFRCLLTALGQRFEGFGESKSRAEKASALKAVEFLDEHDRNKLQLYIAKTVAAGNLRPRETRARKNNSTSALEAFRRTAGLSCTNEAIVQCLTVRADIPRIKESQFETNEEWSFCGSILALVIASEKSPDGTGSTLSVRSHVSTAIEQARRGLFPRSMVSFSPAAYFDVVQALLYAEFLQSGYSASIGVFDRCVLAFRKSSHQAISYDEFQVGIPYTQLLQERVQEIGPNLPEFSFVLTNPTHPHAPIFRCVAVYGQQRAEGLGVSKKGARQRAAYELLRKMIGQIDAA